MTIANPTLGVVARDPQNFKPHPDRWSVGAWGEIVIGGGTDFVTANPPSNEVIDGTGVSLGRDYRVTGTVSAGSLATEEAGDYLVELEIFEYSAGSATGNLTFTIEYAPDGVTYAAFDATDAGGGGRMTATVPAATGKTQFRLNGTQHLNGGGKVRAKVNASGASGAVTFVEGRLRISKVSDNNPVTP